MKSAAEAFADGLRIEHASWRVGRTDAIDGKPWRPHGHELLSYAAGYLAGQHDRRTNNCCEGATECNDAKPSHKSG